MKISQKSILNNKTYNVVDKKTGKIEMIITKEELENLKKDIENIKKNSNIKIDKNYLVIYQNHITNSLINSLSGLKNKKENIDLLGTKKINAYGINFEINNFEKINHYISINTSKLLAFIILNLDTNKNISLFDLRKYAYYRNIKSLIDLNKEVIQQFSIISKLGNIEYKDKCSFISRNIFSITYHRRKGTIEILPEFAKLLKKTYAHIPQILFKMPKYEYLLGYFIFIYSRQNLTCNFNLRIDTCLKKMNINTNLKNDRHFDKRIITPFENTINNLSYYINDLEIEFLHDYSNIKEFKQGYIKINIKNNKIIESYKNLEIERLRKNKKKNIENKSTRKKDTIKLLKEGKTIKEISEIFNLTQRTIKNYIKELKHKSLL